MLYAILTDCPQQHCITVQTESLGNLLVILVLDVLCHNRFQCLKSCYVLHKNSSDEDSKVGLYMTNDCDFTENDAFTGTDFIGEAGQVNVILIGHCINVVE